MVGTLSRTATRVATPLTTFIKTKYQPTSEVLVNQSQSIAERIARLKDQAYLDRRCDEVAELIEERAQCLIDDYKYGVIDLKTFEKHKKELIATAAAIGLSLLVLTTFNPKVEVRDRVQPSFNTQPQIESVKKTSTSVPIQNKVTQSSVVIHQKTDKVTALMRAIIGQESGGKFSITNPHSGALGYGQVMPANVPSWTMEALGYELTPREFLQSPKLQIKVIKFQLQKAWDSQKAIAKSEEEQVRRVASIWYSGRSRLWNNTKPQFYNGHPYPSIADYTRSVWQKYQAELKQPEQLVQTSTQASAQRVVNNALAWVGRDFKKGQSARCADFVRHVLATSGLNVSVSKSPIDKDKQGDARSPLMAQSFFGKDVGQLIWSKNQLKPGDLVAFVDTYGSFAKGSITHVGIYIGDGMMVDRSTRSKPVFKRSVSTFKFLAGVRPYAYQK